MEGLPSLKTFYPGLLLPQAQLASIYSSGHNACAMIQARTGAGLRWSA